MRAGQPAHLPLLPPRAAGDAHAAARRRARRPAPAAAGGVRGPHHPNLQPPAASGQPGARAGAGGAARWPAMLACCRGLNLAAQVGPGLHRRRSACSPLPLPCQLPPPPAYLYSCGWPWMATPRGRRTSRTGWSRATRRRMSLPGSAGGPRCTSRVRARSVFFFCGAAAAATTGLVCAHAAGVLWRCSCLRPAAGAPPLSPAEADMFQAELDFGSIDSEAFTRDVYQRCASEAGGRQQPQRPGAHTGTPHAWGAQPPPRRGAT